MELALACHPLRRTAETDRPCGTPDTDYPLHPFRTRVRRGCRLVKGEVVVMGGGVPLVMAMKRRWCSRNTVLGLGGANHWLWKRTVLGISCTRFDCPEWLILSSSLQSCLSWALHSGLWGFKVAMQVNSGRPPEATAWMPSLQHFVCTTDSSSEQLIKDPIANAAPTRSWSLYSPRRPSEPYPGKSVLQVFGWGPSPDQPRSPVSLSVLPSVGNPAEPAVAVQPAEAGSQSRASHPSAVGQTR